jgi:hypothetical protein
MLLRNNGSSTINKILLFLLFELPFYAIYLCLLLLKWTVQVAGWIFSVAFQFVASCSNWHEERLRKQDNHHEFSEEAELEELMEDTIKDLHENDFLEKAADAKQDAHAAVEARRYDEAWRLFHEQKLNYMKHASKSGFTHSQTLALDVSVSEHLANVLRLEGKHADALAHIIYWIASSTRTTETQKTKLMAYFNRARLKRITVLDIEHFVEHIKHTPDFPLIQKQVKAWKRHTANPV